MTIALAARAELPAEVTSFVDRQGETAEIQRLLGGSRLVTLTGTGGVGKTRLAIRTARSVRPAYADGVHFIDLTATQDPDLLVQTVAGALGVLGTSGADDVETLTRYFDLRHCLLVLDNCEHLLGPAARLCAELLQACPNLHILATSRESLGIFGEAAHPVRSLSVPDRRSTAGEVADFESVRLFVARAVEAYPQLQITPESLGVIGRICARLDGLPLAIELAAVRVRVLSPHQILERLTDRYRLLTGGRRDSPDRHRTLRAAIEWSYELCSPQEQSLWARLTVFTGHWELDAAEQICSDEAIGPDHVLDLLQALVEKSVVVREDDDTTGSATYRMLETIREFGSDQLDRRAERRDVVRRHREWYQDLLRRAETDWISPRQPYWLRRMYHELPNIRAALERCLEQEDEADEALALAVPAWRICWWALGRVDELHDWLDRILARGPRPGPPRARALVIRNAMTAIQHRPIAEADLTLARTEALAAGDPVAVALSEYVEGLDAMNRSAPAVAVDRFQRALRSLGQPPDRGVEMLVRSMLAIAQQAASGGAEADAEQAEVRRLAEVYGERFEVSDMLQVLGNGAWRNGDLARARTQSIDSARLKRELGDLTGAALSIETLAFAATSAGEYFKAAEIFGAGLAIWQASGASDSSLPHYLAFRQECTERATQAIGADAFERGFAAGAALNLDAALAFALGEAPISGAPSASPLSRRELEIAELVAQGRTNREIAAILFIAVRTAEGHVERVRSKLGFSSRAQIAAWVITQRSESPG